MTTNGFRESAKIYQFPVRGRAAVGAHRDELSAAHPVSPRMSEAASGSGWYHEEAIREAERPRKN